MKKPGMSFEKHEQIGGQLARIYAELLNISVELSQVYPLSSGVPYRMDQAERWLAKLRTRLDSCLFEEHGHNQLPIEKYYFPGGPHEKLV